MFAIAGQYSNTDSWLGGIFAQIYFDENRQRIKAGFGGGKIRNDYQDFLGSGLPAQTTDNFHGYFFRYQHRVGSNWYLGAQAISSNYTIGAEGWLEEIFRVIGLTGFDSNGLGLVAEYDTRNNQRNPDSGVRFVAHNVAYRESLGGEESFDVLNVEFNDYRRFQFRKMVLASQVEGRWTRDAPLGGYSSVSLRGYVRGQALAPNYTQFQADARIPLGGRWGMTVFGGLGCLYDSPSDCGESENLYPSVGAGGLFVLKEDAGVVIRAEYAIGKADNSGFYIRLGHPF